MDLSRGGNSSNNNRQHQQAQHAPKNQEPRAKKQPRMEYFSVRVNPQRINSILDFMFRDAKPEEAKLFRHLQQSRRVQPEFHVTLIHRASAPQHQQYWDRLVSLHSASSAAANGGWEPELGKCDVQLERLVWDDRIMCFVVRLNGATTLQLPSDARNGTEELRFESVNSVAHITVGTASQDVKPKESNDLLQRWLNMGSGGETGIWEKAVRGNGNCDGSVRGVLGRM